MRLTNWDIHIVWYVHVTPWSEDPNSIFNRWVADARLGHSWASTGSCGRSLCLSNYITRLLMIEYFTQFTVTFYCKFARRSNVCVYLVISSPAVSPLAFLQKSNKHYSYRRTFKQFKFWGRGTLLMGAVDLHACIKYTRHTFPDVVCHSSVTFILQCFS